MDDVEFYSCSAELPPSDCGNEIQDTGEQCDDGNDFIGDGCSNNCQVEAGWQCTAPKPPGEIGDPGFEAGTPNPSWTEYSLLFDTPLCDETACGVGTGSGPASGDWWAWFGGTAVAEVASLSQPVTIPATATTLTFALEVPACDSASDYLEVLIDGNQEFLLTGSSPACGTLGYATQSVDITPYADGGSHTLVFHAETFANNLDVTNFFVDDVAIPGVPSACTPQSTTQLTLNKVVVNDNGGSSSAPAWTLSAAGPSPFSGSGPTVSSGPALTPDTYTLSETGPGGYTPSAWVCTGGNPAVGNSIQVQAGQNISCTITNNDQAPRLTLDKVVVNDNGGTALPLAWTLSATGGPTPISGPGAAGSTDVQSEPSFDAGTYTLGESAGPAGYAASAWSCSGGSQNGNQITLGLGQSATCTITNNDIGPTLKLVKTIVNDNGGTVNDPNAFGLKVDGQSVQHNAVNTFTAGPHVASETGLPGYQAGSWAGDCATNGSITLALGQNATCTIANNDVDTAEQIFADGFESN